MSYPFILYIVNWYNNDKLDNYIYNSKEKFMEDSIYMYKGTNVLVNKIRDKGK